MSQGEIGKLATVQKNLAPDGRYERPSVEGWVLKPWDSMYTSLRHLCFLPHISVIGSAPGFAVFSRSVPKAKLKK